MELDGSNVELTGSNGVGKTSVIDAIRYALTNDSNRDYIIYGGETEGQIYIETDTGLVIDRKKRTNQADFKSVKDGKKIVTSPENFLRSLFSDLQINPVAFINMSKKEQNKVILDLVEFSWDLNWIKDKFGEIPEGVDYTQNILQVLYDIQSDNGNYFMTRQSINRDIKRKTAQIEGYGSALPANYDAAYWEAFDLPGKYKELAVAEKHNDEIARAKILHGGFEGKMRGIEADREIAVNAHVKAVDSERARLNSDIAKLQAEIEFKAEQLETLDSKLGDKIALEQAEYDKKVAQLQKDMGVAAEYISRLPIDTKPLTETIENAEKMKGMLLDYNRMKALQKEVEKLEGESEELTEKIQLARELPGVILADAYVPIEGLSVKDGVPLINGMPVTNLSEGEKLDLCIEVALSKTNGIQIILIDGVEKLSEPNRNKLYSKCKEKGVQFIATRTTDEDELQVVTL